MRLSGLPQAMGDLGGGGSADRQRTTFAHINDSLREKGGGVEGSKAAGTYLVLKTQ